MQEIKDIQGKEEVILPLCKDGMLMDIEKPQSIKKLLELIYEFRKFSG